jgi:hypothetical protein
VRWGALPSAPFVFVFGRTLFSGLPLLTRPLLLRASGAFPEDLAPINFAFWLASAHDPFIESCSKDGEGIMSSGSGDLVLPLVWRRGGVILFEGGRYSSSCGEFSGLSSSPSTTQDSPNCNFPLFPGAMIHVRCGWQVASEKACNGAKFGSQQRQRKHLYGIATVKHPKFIQSIYKRAEHVCSRDNAE